jgi:acetolactate synthase small subunit
MSRQLITVIALDPTIALARMTTFFARHRVRVVSLATSDTPDGTVMTVIAAPPEPHTPELMRAQLRRIVDIHAVDVRSADGHESTAKSASLP